MTHRRIWRGQKQAFNCDDHYLRQVYRKWRMLGRLVKASGGGLRKARTYG